jgi:hypothetical protein
MGVARLSGSSTRRAPPADQAHLPQDSLRFATLSLTTELFDSEHRGSPALGIVVRAGGYQRSRLAYIRRRCPDPLRIEFTMLVDSLADETGDTESVKALNQ